jgi:hypothetical protein
VNAASASKRTWLQRAGWLGLGAATFVWLVTEGRSLTIPLLLAGFWILGLIAKSGRHWVARADPGWWTGVRAGLMGLALGAMVPFGALVLILSKTSLHAHPFPDFSVDDVTTVVSTAWVWALGGMLLGLASAALGRRPPGASS